MRTKQSSGFTIVELLIVIVIIAILAAISIVAYRGIQDRANASSAQSLASQTATKLKLYYAEHESYPTTLTDAGITSTTGLQYTYNNTATPKTFCITATTNNKSYYQNTTTNTTPTEGGCAGHGVGGVEAVTNYILNPNLTGTSSVFLNNPANATMSTSGGVVTATITANPALSNGIRFGTSAPSGSFYSARVKVRGVGGAVGKVTYAQTYDNATRAHSGNFTLTSDWQDINVIASAMSATQTLKLYVYFTGAGWSIGDTIQITEPTLQRVAAPSQQVASGFSSGDSPGWIWNGAPDYSSSTGPPFPL